LSLVAPGECFDLVLANINLRVIRAVLPALAGHLAPGGLAILSGVLHEHEATLREAVELYLSEDPDLEAEDRERNGRVLEIAV